MITASLTDTMTVKERWLAALDMKPVDRLPFWPKIGGSYQRAQAGTFAEMSPLDIHKYVGSDRHEHVPAVHCEKRSNSSVERQEIDERTARTIFRVGDHGLTAMHSFDPDSQSWHPVEFPVKTPADIPVYADFVRDAKVEYNAENAAKAKERYDSVGDDAVMVDGIGESPLMNFVEHIAGVENAHFFLMDCRDQVEDLFDAMHQNLLRKSEITADKGVADATYFVENTSTTLISPMQYKQYCFRHLGECAGVLDAGGKRVILHMCGHLKGLLDQLCRLPVRAFEAFTSPTLGNTTLLDGRTVCPDTCLIGGTNAMLWLKPAAGIIEQIEGDLEALPHHRGIVVTSAGVMPPFCRPDTIKAVCEWVKEYPVRL